MAGQLKKGTFLRLLLPNLSVFISKAGLFKCIWLDQRKLSFKSLIFRRLNLDLKLRGLHV